MTLGEKVSLMRSLKGFTQEEMAQKLNMSLTGYAKIERGETKLQNPRLEKIVETLGIELRDLLNFDERNVFNHSFQDKNVYINSAIELTQELEKMKVLAEQKDKEISLLKQQNEDLRAMLDFLKK